MGIRLSSPIVILIKFLHCRFKCRHKWRISWFGSCSLPSSVHCFDGWECVMKWRSWPRWKGLLGVISILCKGYISNDDRKVLVQRTCRRLQNNRTRSHSSSVSVRSPILRHLSALVSFMLSSYTKSSTNCQDYMSNRQTRAKDYVPLYFPPLY